MGRMLVQMLGMFAQFERDTIIDRVIAGVERKAAAGKWKGGRRPFGYRVDPATSILVPDVGEAAVVRLIFNAYTRNRLGGKAVADVLNERGNQTTTGGPWSAHQVLRVLSSRVYLGELTFRGITAAAATPRSLTTPPSPRRSGSSPPAARTTPSGPRMPPITCSRG
jgi:site-specific DNA recombinase